MTFPICIEDNPSRSQNRTISDFQDSNLLVFKSSKTKQSCRDIIRLYLQEIARFSLLTAEEEVTKAQQVQRYVRLIEPRQQDAKSKPVNLPLEELEKIQKTGLLAKRQMIEANLRLVVSVAKKYQNRGLELLDLIQEGTLGLEKAVEKFDPTKGCRFSTYAYWWIRQGITSGLMTQGRMIRLPGHILEKLNRIKKVQRQLIEQKGRLPKIEEIAQELNIGAEQIRDVLFKTPRAVSLEIKVGNDKDAELIDFLETDVALPEENLIKESFYRDLHLLLEELSSKEREVIEMRYGLLDGDAYSLAEVGNHLNLSRERVRQIENKALQKLRYPERRNQMRDYFETLS